MHSNFPYLEHKKSAKAPFKPRNERGADDLTYTLKKAQAPHVLEQKTYENDEESNASPDELEDDEDDEDELDVLVES